MRGARILVGFGLCLMAACARDWSALEPSADGGAGIDASSGTGGVDAGDAGGTSGKGGTSGDGDAAGGGGPTSCRTPGVGVSDCGPAGNDDCCRSLDVPGGAFHEQYYSTDLDGGLQTNTDYPSAVSAFRLDKYEITVGRFRRFVAAWDAGWRPAVGAGKHTYLNGGQGLLDSSTGTTYEPGWNGTKWDVQLATTSAGWKTNLSCAPNYATWTGAPGSNERLPINCLNWFEAYAFCIWDGGFLPSIAEWSYAASGGDEQRMYPWGAQAPGASGTYAVYDCFPCSTNAIAPVGTPTAGDGRWGQSNLAGNVTEWALDAYYPQPSTTSCKDCADFTASSYRMQMGGAFDYSDLLDAVAQGGDVTAYDPAFPDYGARCARAPTP